MPVLISVIVPTYNCGAKLDSTLDSIEAQGDGLCECIVVDGGSLDDTMARVSARGTAVRSISEPDQGIYDAMNKGIDMARGDWLYFLGAGDIVVPGAFQSIQPFLAEISGPTVVYGKVARSGSGIVMGRLATPFRLCYGENIPHQATFYHRSVFKMLGGYSIQYPILSDFAFNLRCFGDPTISMVYIDRVFAQYEGGGASDVRRDDVFFRDYPAMIRKEFGVFWALLYAMRRLAGATKSCIAPK